jgi:hypothetical protein
MEEGRTPSESEVDDDHHLHTPNNYYIDRNEKAKVAIKHKYLIFQDRTGQLALGVARRGRAGSYCYCYC